MRTKNAAFLTALLSLKAIGVYGITCNVNHSLGSEDPPALGLASTVNSAVDGPVKSVCEKAFSSNDIKYTDGQTTFMISRTNEEIKMVEDCKTPFDKIIAQCVMEAGVWGGSIEVDGLLFEIGQTSTLEARKSKGKSSGSKKKKKPKTKKINPKPKTKKPRIRTKKPKTKKHATKTRTSKGKATAKPTSKKIHSTKVSVTSTATAKACALPTGKKGGKKGAISKRAPGCGDDFTCKDLIKAVKKELSALTIDEELSDLSLESRSDSVGAMSAMSSRHVSGLEKRTAKSANACGVKLKADGYPEKDYTSGTFRMVCSYQQLNLYTQHNQLTYIGQSGILWLGRARTM